MVQMKANEVVTTFFSAIKERAEILDDRGNVLGYFTPVESDADLRRRIVADYESGEYRKRKLMAEGEEKLTTDQVLERLRSLQINDGDRVVEVVDISSR